MYTITGEVMGKDELRKKFKTKEEFEEFCTSVNFDELSKYNQQKLIRTGKAQLSKNSRCPCGSGLKFKRCCMKRRQTESF